jgi:hypothetical protein
MLLLDGKRKALPLGGHAGDCAMAYSKTRGIRYSLELVKPKAALAREGSIAVIPGGERLGVFGVKHPPHVALANLLDNEKAALKFVESFGPLFSSREYLRNNSDARSLLPLPHAESVRELLKQHPGADFYHYGTSLIYQQRDILRKAWEGDRSAIESMRQHAAANVTSQWKFHHGRIDITAPDAWTVVCVLFLIDHESGNTVICENNEDCPAPYFVRKRRTQKFCESGPCVAHGQRLRSRKWWSEHGNEWREQAQKKSSGRAK